jgi:hypothetical protein
VYPHACNGTTHTYTAHYYFAVDFLFANLAQTLLLPIRGCSGNTLPFASLPLVLRASPIQVYAPSTGPTRKSRSFPKSLTLYPFWFLSMA